MARRLCYRPSLFSFLLSFQKPHSPSSPIPQIPRFQFDSTASLSETRIHKLCCPCFQVSRPNYDLFGEGQPGDEEFRKAWEKEWDDDSGLWTGSEDEGDTRKRESRLENEIRKVKRQAKEHSDLTDGDDSDELRSVWSGSDKEKALWTGSEGDDDDDIPSEASPNESSDAYLDELFEFEETLKYCAIPELLKAEKNPKELSPGKQARKLAVENALKKLNKKAQMDVT